MGQTFSALIAATASIAVLHALAPDHWLPFVMIGKAQKWSKSRLLWVTAISGVAHVGSSVILGSVGLLLGDAVIQFQGIEAVRGHIAVLLLIGFGLAYAAWGIWRSRTHRHISFDLSGKRTVTLWTVFAVFVLGPCEPLIPLMFLSTPYGTIGIVVVTLLFAAITLFMMVGQAFLGMSGIELVKHEFAERYSHALAGSVITLTGVFLLIL